MFGLIWSEILINVVLTWHLSGWSLWFFFASRWVNKAYISEDLYSAVFWNNNVSDGIVLASTMSFE